MAGLPVLPLWLFSSDPDLRRRGVLIALACALACVAVIAVYQRAAGGRRPYRTISIAEFSGGAEGGGSPAPDPAAPPRVLPSRRALQWRTLGWYVGCCTALVTLAALVMGQPQRPELMQRIADAGAEFAHVRVEKVSDVRLHDPSKGKDYYTSTAVVRLAPGKGGPVTATVHPTSPDRPRPGDEVAVLYAPTRPDLGAIAGDESSLGDDLAGDTMGAFGRWITTFAWICGIVLSVAGLSLRHGFRSFSRLGGADMAVRGRCTGPGYWRRDSAKERCLLFVTESSRTAHFLIGVTERQLPDSLNDQRLWLCWGAPRGTGGRLFSPSSTSAALVSDDGWVMHGMLKVDDAKPLAAEGVSVERAGGEGKGDSGPLRLWDPRSAWPLFVHPAGFALAALFLACAALLTYDLSGVWRWGTGIGGAVAAFAFGCVATAAPHLPPSERNAD
ncbi:hypothetical protein [Streptomyces sp. NPDC048650]|uniref:hypothetical protein n=1 Tax=unclassified Streptomyces TaxID=2593676 RepID=UPI0037198C02